MFKTLRFSFFLLLIAVIGGWVFYTYQVLAPLKGSEQTAPFVIETGESVKQISRHLLEQNLISNTFWFEVYVWQKGLQRNFLAGVYDLPGNLSIREAVSKLTTPGESEQTITIPEGWSNKEIAAYLEKQNLVAARDFLALISRDLSALAGRHAFLADKPLAADLEGYLFPDTYRVYRNSSGQEIVNKMLENFDKKLTPELRQEIKRRNKSLFEIITLASIIEKEVQAPDDMRIVADIFYKRLNASIALQADSSINYLTGHGRAQSTAEDLKIDSPYNTYKYRGLPPGPISNPGLNAIMAAVYPTPNQYYYFLTTAEGQVIYARTYDEHVANKRKYLD